MRSSLFPIMIALSTLTACGLPQLDVAPRYGLMSLDGDFGISSGPLTASANLDALGLGDDESTPGLRADFTWSGAHVILSTTQMDFSGRGTLDATLSQGGVTIPLGATVDSNLDLGVHSGLFLWDLFPGDTIELAAGLGVTLLDFKMDITDTGTSLNIRADESLPIPVLAANAGVNLGSFEGNLLVSGFSLSSGGNSGSFVDIDASLRYQLLGGDSHLRGSFILGWRQLDISLDYDDNGDTIAGDIGVSGPYVALEFTL